MSGWLVGVDIGGTGTRVAARPPGARDERRPAAAGNAPDGAGGRVPVVRAESAGAGTTRADVVSAIERAVADGVGLAGGEPIAAVGVGTTRFATYRDELVDLRLRLSDLLRTPVVLAADALTTHVGALAGRPGATLAAGTGAIVLAESAAGEVHRIDGWGHLLGDDGSGAGIGRRAMVIGLEQLDGRREDAAALRDALETRLGDPRSWPRAVYEHPQRATLFAGLVPVVASLAEAGDAVSAGLLDEAADGLARSCRAALGRAGVPPRLALAGGLVGAGILHERLRARLDGVEVVTPAGDAVEGALTLAARAAGGDGSLTAPDLLAW